MPGTPGRSGGKRPGAGRPVESRTLHTGQRILYHEFTADDHPVDVGGMVTVEIISRTKLILRHENGTQFILGY